jgi:hypothetical protein
MSSFLLPGRAAKWADSAHAHSKETMRRSRTTRHETLSYLPRFTFLGQFEMRFTLKGLLQTPCGPRWRADAGFEPGGQIFEMNAPAAVDGGVVGIPVLTFADASVNEMETCAIVFSRQLSGNGLLAPVCKISPVCVSLLPAQSPAAPRGSLSLCDRFPLLKSS